MSEATPGGTLPRNVTVIGGSDGTHSRALLTDSSGQLQTSAAAAPTTTTVAQVASSASSTTLKAANASRRGLYVFNDSTAILYVKLGATASTASYTVQVPAGGFYEMPAPYYRGVVDGIWSAAVGNAYVTEVS